MGASLVGLEGLGGEEVAGLVGEGWQEQSCEV